MSHAKDKPQGVAFGILRRSGVGGVEFGKGSGFVVARRREAPDVHTGEKFAPHYRQMRKTKADDSRVKEGRPGWTAPSYFELTCGGCGDPWGTSALCCLRGCPSQESGW